MVKILLVSTYELGRQPVHLASPAAALTRAGHEVRMVDVSVSSIESQDLEWADRVAISTTMHTATRLGGEIATEASALSKPVAAYGLYAHLAADYADVTFGGEYEPALLAWMSDGTTQSTSSTARSEFNVPVRNGLAPLGDYARLEFNGETKLVGAVEASHGCRHRCTHCPLPVVYDGRLRVVPADVILEDIDNLVSAGAEHITFGDPDFLNAPAHSMSVIEAARESHPNLTFDATIKVSHLLDHQELLPRLAAANLLFIVSAFESVDDVTLQILDKQHTRNDMIRSLDLVREAGIFVRPTWLPFMPWSTADHVADIFEFISTQGLLPATDPVQLSIKLLVPRGSLLESHEAMFPYLSHYDAEALTWRWSYQHQEADVLQKELESIASEASDCGEETGSTLHAMGAAITRQTGREFPSQVAGEPVPRLTESWFCCSEPTPAQTQAIQIGRSR